ncbi:MAG: cation:proton antiporter [Liquorilactobacillus nagelii]|jgi:CPA2 family monovalent cation:H+ antiporter-2|uniref:cation:proton antiporter domain-containing protein n=1 Tax=Liquorilactobacillus nagelii TaxID=82688 RepID=UPI0039E9EB69
MSLSLIIVALAAFATPLLLAKLNISTLPTAVAEITVGIILGKSLLHVVQANTTITFLADLGVILLLFLSGMEIDFSLFQNKQPQTPLDKKKAESSTQYSPLKLAIITYAVIILTSAIIAAFFSFSGLYSNFWLATILFATIALGVVIAALKEKELLNSRFGQTILLIAVLGEVVPMLALTAFASIYDGHASQLWLIGILFVVAAILFKRFRAFFDFFQRINKATTQLDIRLAFFFIFLLAFLAERVGAENILGAFIAGIVIKLLEPEESTREKLDAIGYGFLIPIFFIMTGANLDIPSLLQEPTVLILIPLFFLGFLLAKSLAFFVLKRYFQIKNALAGSLLSATTITLVLAALQVAREVQAINSEQAGEFLIAAILTCLLGPLCFNHLFITEPEDTQKIKVNFIGANILTISAAQQLDQWYDIQLYTDRQDNYQTYNSEAAVKLLPDLKAERLIKEQAFDTDILVLGYRNYQLNYQLALAAKKYGVKRVITRFENRDIMSDLGKKMSAAEIEYFNSADVNVSVLRSLIETPSTLQILTANESRIFEVVVRNRLFARKQIKDLSFANQVTISRIFRNGTSIAPHGNTRLELNDHIVFMGKSADVPQIRRTIEKMNE